MRDGSMILFCAATLALACIGTAGCGSGEESETPSGEALEQPPRLWPEVPEAPAPSEGASGSLTETGGTAGAAEGAAAEGGTAEGTAPEGGSAEGGAAEEGGETAGTGETSGGGGTTPPAAGSSGGGAAGAGLDALPAAVKQAATALAAKAPAVSSVAFDIQVTESGGASAAGGPPMPGPPQNGRVEAAPPDKVRIEGAGDMNGKPAELLMVMNGPKVWIEASDPGTGQPAQVIKMDLSSMPGAKASGGPIPFVSPRCDGVLGQMAEKFTFQTVADVDLDGEACQVFEGKGSEGSVRVWIAKSDGMLRRIEERDASGNPTSDTRVSNIQVNPSIDASRFEYTPPDGVQVMDMGELMKQMIEGMGEAMKEGMKSMGGASQE